MAWQCGACGTVYEQDEANYCNACGSENLYRVIDPPPSPKPIPSLRDDPYSLVLAGLLWGSGIIYVSSHRRPGAWGPLIFTWAFLTLMGVLLGLVVRNVRTFLYFAGLGAICLLLYGLIKLT